MNIGIYGGTFDPVHLGHLIVAEEVRVKLGLKRVLFVPAGKPWMKASRREITSGDHRLAMIRLAIAGNPDFDVSTIDLERPGQSYSVETISCLREVLGPEAKIYFILGCDALNEVHLWKDPARLISMCYMVAAPRPGCKPPDLERLEQLLPGISGRTVNLEMEPVGISSSEVRRRLAAGLSVRYFLPPGVEPYIRRYGLYLPPGRQEGLPS